MLMIILWAKQQLEFLVLAYDIKGIRVSVVVRILHIWILFNHFHSALRLEQDEPKISLETLYS